MKQKKSRIIMYSALLIAIVMIVTAVFVSAKYIKRATVKNSFTPAVPVTPEVYEPEFDGSIKENVPIYVGETGYDVYVRATIVITWKDKDGVVLYEFPVESVPIMSGPLDQETVIYTEGDYTLSLNLSDTGWVYSNDDGYYYYTKPVASEGYTDILVKECKPTVAPDPDGPFLSVEIVAQTIQAAGTTDDGDIPAYKNAWNTSVDMSKN